MPDFLEEITMLGAIIGDIVGSFFEWHNTKKTRFPLFTRFSRPTDDSVMTIAVADALMHSYGEDDDTVRADLVKSMQYYGRKYPDAGYGGRFFDWIHEPDPRPYGSWGNGSAMRVSPVGWLYDELTLVLHMAELTAAVTHDHPEGIKGAKAIAAAVFMARKGMDKMQIKTFTEEMFDYDLDFTLDEIRPRYKFDVSCQGSVPQAIRAFLEGDSYEQCIRLAISIGGDSDTIACMAGAIAEAYYGIPEEIKARGLRYLDESQSKVVLAFRDFYHSIQENNDN